MFALPTPGPDGLGRSNLLQTFTELGVPRNLVESLARRGVTSPFPIQESTIAQALAGRDLCGRAPTGSGKTLAFAIPLAMRTGKGKPRRPRALVLVPTRELAGQITDVLRPLAENAGRTVGTFYGGTPLNRDRRRLRGGVDIVVACPGRLADLARQGEIDLRAVDFVVLDEADRMADMGFLPEVQWLLDQTAPDRQTLLFSATLDHDVDVLTRKYQHDPVRYELEERATEQGDVQHFFWRAERSARVLITSDVVRAAASAIVFTRTKHAADRVTRQLRHKGVSAVAIHGNRSQNQRERALADFSSGRAVTLVATDVAARGLHIDNVGAVIHFDPPASGKDYVHRSGRTGRAGADGLVVTLVTPDKQRDVSSLQRELRVPQRLEPVDVEQLDANAPSGSAAVVPAFSGAPTPEHRPRQPKSRGRRGQQRGGRKSRTSRAPGNSGTPGAGSDSSAMKTTRTSPRFPVTRQSTTLRTLS
ncbi:MAG: DEAD/DEAH box helicase [Nitriliruptorales bacterium]|nr:DEAD/DEAH box helicase [Nitriliruptorales bacterium]